MPHTSRRSASTPRSTLRAGTLILVVAVQSMAPSWAMASPATGVATGPTGTPEARASTAAAGLEPTIHWQEAAAHEHDRIAFKAGDRVTVPFRPRSGDRWTVGGVVPRVLPAGRLDGGRMRAIDPDPAPAARPERPVAEPATTVETSHARSTGSDRSAARTLQAPVDPGALRREVFGFLPYWQVNASTLRIQYDKISTIAYFGVGADAAGNLQKRNADGSTTTGWSGWTSSRLTSIIDAAHASGTRVVLTVQSFAWNSTGRARQKALLGSWTARQNLARQIAAAVRDRGADGVNLDFEPLVSGREGQFTALVRSIRTELDRVHRGYQLTFDTTGYIGNYPIEAATKSGGADAIFIMGYDYRGSSSSPVGSVAPLSRPGYDIRDTVAAYVARVPASKLILGVPYYGRAWSTASSAIHGRNISGTRYGPSSTVTYTSALPFFAEHGKRYDTSEQVAWTVYRRQHCTSTYGCQNPWRQLYVDDARALGAKYDLVNRYGLRGAGIWALGYDGTRPELWDAIGAKFITDSVPPTIRTGSVSAPMFSPNGDGRLDSTTVRMTANGLVRWGYRVQAVVGSSLGPNLRSGTVPGRNVVFTWNGQDSTPAVVADGTYRVTLWAEDASANRAERAATVVVDARPAALTPTVSRGFLTPDGDGQSDSLPLAWTSNEAVVGSTRVREAGGSVQRSWPFTTRSRWNGVWDGRGPGGATVKDGRYLLEVQARDRAGNPTTSTRPFIVDRTIRSVRWSDGSFDPGAGQRSQVRIDLRRAALVSVRIYRGSTPVRIVWTERSLAAGIHAWNWNGRTATGAVVAPGTYRVVVFTTSWLGETWSTRNVVVEKP